MSSTMGSEQAFGVFHRACCSSSLGSRRACGNEIHERSLDADLLSLILRLLFGAEGSSTRLVVMSATLEARLFLSYFSRITDNKIPE
eukprot:gene16766-20460_t